MVGFMSFHHNFFTLLCLCVLICLSNISIAYSLDKSAYDAKLIENANNPAAKPGAKEEAHLWPAKTVYPLDGALLPFNRIVAYYGNFYSKHMGVLGEYPEDQMLQMLQAEVNKWKKADPNTPVIPAIDYIAVVAQGQAGKDGKYRARMPDDQVQKGITMANKINGLLFLDVQVGQSTLQQELPPLQKYLTQKNVMLAIDPEFSMKTGEAPGKTIGTFDASDINYAITFLADIVKQNNLPPKILVVHRFTQHMITNYKNIKVVPEVQVVIDMDGWGYKGKKHDSYKYFVAAEPVEFTGFKLFYKNDLKQGGPLYTPEEIMQFTPRPVYILYQ